MNEERIKALLERPQAPAHLSEHQLSTKKALPWTVKVGFSLGGIKESIMYGCGSIPILRQGKEALQNVSYGVNLGAYDRRLSILEKQLEAEQALNDAPEAVDTERFVPTRTGPVPA